MKPLDFYRLGLALAANAGSEAVQRTAVSRLYYGLHHEACCRFFRENPAARPLNRNRRHSGLVDRCRELDDSITTEIAQLLVTLSLLRSESDYQLAPPLRFRNQSYSPRDEMEYAVGFASQLMEALDLYSPGAAPDGCRCPVVYSRG